jgi:hypothetical protein
LRKAESDRCKDCGDIITTAISRIWAAPGENIVCTRRVLRETPAPAIEKAHEIGLLAGQEARFRDHCLGDVRWAPAEQIIRVFYVGRKTACQIRNAMDRLEEKHVG